MRRLRDLRQVVSRRREAVAKLAPAEAENKENALVQALSKAERQTRNAAALLAALKRIVVSELAGKMLVEEFGVAQKAVDNILSFVQAWTEKAKKAKQPSAGSDGGDECEEDGEEEDEAEEEEAPAPAPAPAPSAAADQADEFEPSEEDIAGKQGDAERRVMARDAVRRVVADLWTPPAPKPVRERGPNGGRKRVPKKKKKGQAGGHSEPGQGQYPRRRERQRPQQQRRLTPEERQAAADQQLLRDLRGVEDLTRPQKKAKRAAMWRESQRQKKAKRTQASLARLVGIADEYDAPLRKRTVRACGGRVQCTAAPARGGVPL